MNTGIWKWLKTRCQAGDERGITLIEAAVAVLLLGGAVLTMVLSMSGGVLAVEQNDQEVVAQGLARTQLEFIKTYAYAPGAGTYPAVEAPEGYSILVTVSAVPGAGDGIQKITATINRGGQEVLTVQDYKVDR